MPTPHSQATFGIQPSKTTPLLPTRARLVQADGHHEVLLLSFTPELADTARYSSGIVMAAAVGYAPGLQVPFYGYSDVTQPKYTSNQVKTTTLMCTGPTYPLRDSGEADWPDGTACHVVAARIARKFQLSSTCAVTTVAAPAGPHNESWWQYLRRMADLLGWTLRASRTDIQLMPRRIDSTTTLLFRLDPTKVVTQTQRILKFEAVSGDTAPGTRATTVALGVTDDGQIVQAVDGGVIPTPATRVRAPALVSTRIARPVGSVSEAQTELLAQRERTRLGMTAKLTVQGNRDLRNGVTVLLRDLDSLHDGYWYVDRVEHLVDESKTYQCVCEISKAAGGDPNPTFTPGPANQVWYVPGQAPPPPASNPVLVGGGPLPGLPDIQTGRWIASPATARVVSV